ncbi:MAG: 3-keto-5-aminohexanoate cleavage protein [Amnibacterium sp.]
MGFEDTLVLPDGTLAPDNAALVAAARAIGAGDGDELDED